jgi:preprotein translocase subunit SecA
MGRFLDLFAGSRGEAGEIRRINALREEYSRLTDEALRAAAEPLKDLLPMVAVTAVIASRVLGQDMFDVQLRGSLALARGKIAEMQTGEGKTLAAVPAAAWYARQGSGVHVMTVNDYLAKRDAAWMGEIYRRLGLSVGYLQQGMSTAERQAAYGCDVMYATANEIGFDFLRDRLALQAREQVQRPFSAAVIDEADSILIDEARIPLVIAGGDAGERSLAHGADRVVRTLRPLVHWTVDVGSNNAALTDAGINLVEGAFRCGNLYEERNFNLLTAVQDGLHAHALLRRDVDYVVKDGVVEMVDEFKGRIAQDRRWPAGIHTAVEVKEGLAEKRQGMILGSITLQHLIALYPRVCGMTGTAATQALEFEKIYGMQVETIPTNRPVIRMDEPDEVFATKAEKEQAVLAEIRRVHATGRPVLVGTGSVEESERLSGMLGDVRHEVLNARNDEMEAGIVAGAGERGAVTISTNMAGRGTDIRLGEGVPELGGLCVIGTQKHESRRIDNQLRGRAGRQGDPGSSRFFVSLEDDLLVKYGDINPKAGSDPDTVQRLVEGRNLDQRMFLQRYELPVEGQRHHIHEYRQEVLEGRAECGSEPARLVTLRTIDDLWADYLARVAEFRAGFPWLDWSLTGIPFLSLDRRDPQYEFAQRIHQWFQELEAEMPEEIARRVEEAEAGEGGDPGDRGAVWTYLTTDQPFGSFVERMARGVRRRKTQPQINANKRE